MHVYVQEKYDVTGVTKYNFLIEHTWWEKHIFLQFKFKMSAEDIYDISEGKNKLSSSSYIPEVGNIDIDLQNLQLYELEPHK